MRYFGLIVVFVFWLEGVFAQVPTAYPAKVFGSPAPESGDCFGISLALQDDHLFLAAPGRAGGQTDQEELFGKVFIYRWNAGEPIFLQQLDGFEDSLDRRFGISLAAGPGFLVVGSHNYYHHQDNPRAAVEIFEEQENGTWSLAQRIQMTTDSLIRGASIVEVAAGENMALAAIFDRVFVITKHSGTWRIVSEILDPSEETFSSFGSEVILDEERLFIVDRSDTEDLDSAGAIYCYEKAEEGWTLVQKIKGPFKNSYLGTRLALDGDWLAAMDRNEYVRMYHFNRGSSMWEYAHSIRQRDGIESLAIHGGEMLLGTQREGAELYSNKTGSSWELVGCLARRASEGLNVHMGGNAFITDNVYILGSGRKSNRFQGFGLPEGRCGIYRKPAFVSYEQWEAEHFSEDQKDLGISGKGAVNNEINYSNWECYAMGLNPVAPNPDRLPRLIKNSENEILLRYELSPTASDVLVKVQCSADLQIWRPELFGFEELAYSSNSTLMQMGKTIDSYRFFRFDFVERE